MKRIGCVVAISCCFIAFSQPNTDSSFHFRFKSPYFQKPKVIAIDAIHNNRHTKDTGLSHLTKILEQDGFLVKENKELFSQESLKEIDILIIVNALHDSNAKRWELPCLSAFTNQEIDVLKDWVEDGGRLFLSADHMPYSGAVQKLARAFQVEWGNNFDQSKKKRWPPASFDRSKGTLLSSAVTDSSHFAAEVSQIGTFTGSGFRSSSLTPFLIFDSTYELLYPKIAWKFSKKTKRINAKGWCQGAYGEFGKGKVVFMGESAMFTAQSRGRTKIGMNSPDAPENAQLAVNIFRYLAID
ncbi:MAG: hypothetical protein AAFY41_04930 [Bacteroidota bacterium]